MEGPRPPTERELPQVLEFLNHHLRPHAEWSIDNEYPTALGPTNLGNIRIITDQNKVLSHAVLKPLIIKSPTINYKIAAIGSVVTDSQHRNQGLSKRILDACLMEAQKQDCDLAILWTNLYDFYRKVNFELAGYEESIVIEREFEAPTQGLKFLQGTKVAPDALLRLYNHHTVGSIRTLEEMRKFLAIPKTILYTAWDVQGQLAAYAVEGKGADLNGYIHEWGGSVSKLLALFSHIRREKKTPYTIILPLHSLNLLAALKAIPGVTFNEGYLGMLKMVNATALLNKVKKAARTIGIQDLVLEKQGNTFLLGAGNDFLEVADEKEIIKVLFGPVPEIPDLKPETIAKLERLFPLPLWLWGWDSI